ncbi:MAG TPA: pseudouridine synthase [Candidatus Limnocylindrales bacterium]
MPSERLQKVLATAGVASRRGAEALIAAGRVTVDGRPAVLGERIDPGSARVSIDGRAVELAPRQRIHLALHKPAGVTSTVRDRHAARTVLEYVPPDIAAAAGRLYPVGRLDLESEGLILLTNDGEWAEHVLHPRFGVEREYAVALPRPLAGDERSALEAGIDLDEGLARLVHLRPATAVETRRLATLLDPPPGAGVAWYRVTLRHGWRRQLRRMFAGVGVPIARLVRVRIGPVWLGDLRAGALRVLKPAEARSLPGEVRGRQGDRA